VPPACTALYPTGRLAICTGPSFTFFSSTNVASHTHRLDFWETSQDEATGEIRFRRQTQLVGRSDGHSRDSASTTALPMARRSRPQLQSEERYVERFEAHDIALDDESESMRDGNRSIVLEDDKSESGWVHAR